MANNSRRLIKGQPLRLADDPGWRRASPPLPLNRNARKRGARSIDADKRVGGQAKRRRTTDEKPTGCQRSSLYQFCRRREKRVKEKSPRILPEALKSVIRRSRFDSKREFSIMVAFSSRSRKCHRSIIQSERMLSSIPFGNKVRFISILFDVFFSFRRS